MAGLPPSTGKYREGDSASHGAVPQAYHTPTPSQPPHPSASADSFSAGPTTSLHPGHHSGPVPHQGLSWSTSGVPQHSSSSSWGSASAGVPMARSISASRAGSASGAVSSVPEETTDPTASETQELFRQGYAFEGAAIVALVDEPTGQQDQAGHEKVQKTMEIVLDDGVMLTLELDSGEKRLNELGYTQTLQRDLTGFELFSTGFTTVSLFAGIVPYYSTAFANGGPVAVIWYWWIPGVFANIMALSLAEIASSFPLAGSMYFWAAHLAPPSIRPISAWITGWLEFIGSSVGAGGTVLAGIFLLSEVVQISRSTLEAGAPASAASPASDAMWVESFTFTSGQQFGWAAGVLLLVGLFNFAKVKLLGQLMAASAVYQILLGVVIIIAVPCIAPTTQPASWVFTQYEGNWVGYAPNASYAFIIAMLLSQYCLYAMDSAAHISEEAKRADINTPIAMVAALSSITVLAWGILVALTFSIQDEANLSATGTVTGGTQYVVQILWDVFYGRFGSGVGALVFVVLIYFSFLFCSVSQIMTASRVAYALARDKGLPFSSLFSHITAQKVPIPAIILTCTIALISLIPSLFTLTAYYAVTGMATVGWFSAYAVPMFFRLIMPEEDFTPGPFYLAKYIGVAGGKLVHLVGLLYVLYTIAVFLLPTSFPVQTNNFNYASLGIVIAVTFFLGWWVLDARRWFRGPYIKERGEVEAGNLGNIDGSFEPSLPEEGPVHGGKAPNETVEWY